MSECVAADEAGLVVCLPGSSTGAARTGGCITRAGELSARAHRLPGIDGSAAPLTQVLFIVNYVKQYRHS